MTKIDVNNIVLTKMTEAHTHYVAEIENACFSKPWSLQSIQNELQNNNAYFWVAILDSKVIGYCGMHNALDEWYIANIAVLPEYQGNGLGTILTKQLVDYAQKQKGAFITLEVRPSNHTAVNIYSKLGFEKLGLRKNFYSSPIEDGLIMTLNFNTENNQI